MNNTAQAFSDATHPPLFVVGVARSGTTYLYHLLSEHPDIRLSYEGRLPTEGWHVYRKHRDLGRREHFERLLDDLAACAASNKWVGQALTAEARQALFESHQSDPSFSSLIERIYQLPGAVRSWGNKMLRIEQCPDVLAHWPEARFVVLLRDPRAVYASQKEKFPTRRIKYSAIYWTLHARWMRRHAAGDSRYLAIRYEDLVRNPETTLESILGLVNLRDSDHARRMLAAQPAHTQSLDKWRQKLSSQEIETLESLCYEEMEQAGYEPEVANSAQSMGPVTRAIETMLENKHRVPLRPSMWRQKSLVKRFLITVRQ